jgi:D-inositol-3-phosphate glycosyltransferase
MRILSVSHYYPPHVGGLEVVAARQAHTLQKDGHDVTVVTFAHYGQTPVRTQEDGVVVYRCAAVNFFDRHFGIPFPFAGVGFVRRLWHEIRAADVVSIHDVLYQSSWIAYICARLLKKPVILTQHVGLVDHPNILVMLVQRLVYRLFGRPIFHGSRYIIVYNRIVADFLHDNRVDAKKIREMRNGIDLSVFRPGTAAEKVAARRAFALPIDRPVVLFVGRLVPKKGFKTLFEARAGAYEIVFAGSGEIPAHGKVASNVHFLGPIAREQLPALYRAADVFVLPARGELFTLAMQEAMASGVPVITSGEAQYASYDLKNAGVVLCEPTVREVALHIAEIVADEEKRATMSRAAFAFAETWFNVDRNAHALIDVYRSIKIAHNVVVTTSWDDGHMLDMRLSQLMKKYGINGTFYIAPHDSEIELPLRLAAPQVAELSQHFEIGAHTLTHPYLPSVDAEQARTEIYISKAVLEEWTGKSIRSFCYPKGGYTQRDVEIVREAGFTLGRTVDRFSLSTGDNALQLPTTIHTYDHFSDLWPVFSLARYNPVRFARLYRRWDRQAIALFDKATIDGGVFHLWGHSWEIEKNGDWDRLERVFAHIGKRADVRYVANGELV